MARTDTLTNFLSDVADSIRSKTGKSDAIACEDFDTEIESISGGGTDISEYLDNVIQPTSEWEGTVYTDLKTILKKLPNNLTLGTGINNISMLFSNYTNLVTIPLFNTSNVIKMDSLCNNCSNLVNIPLFDTSNTKSLSGSFYNCPSLSNESLNNILAMCINVSSDYLYDKCLEDIGLSEEQITICHGLSNYQAFLNAGWTDNYE